ncbi:MAG: DUF1926 domain-containing protein [Candidatus Krumholzibacteriota bacterium]|nr:DUF1926 domain-containing protein [Candidatus Krumholzibacteriota bacterium]
MSNKTRFILGLHNHQPVGNFDHVIEDAYVRAYLPFLDVMKDYPDIPFALHNSGILWDWFEQRHPEYLDMISAMVSAGQIELMSAGYYEPILTVIPSRDRSGQLSMMSDYLEKHFRIRPRGCWLTERIWDPHMPETLSAAGLEYVLVDDSHFKSTGFEPAQLKGYFLTEENGSYIKVFPIDKNLRYLIPFHDPEETMTYLGSLSRESSGGEIIAVLADDGEKFGLWTGTNSLCYGENWLRRFCDALRANNDWLETTTFSRVLDSTVARSIVYLPTASYVEMMEWALPVRAQESYNIAKEALEASGSFPDPAEALRGGLWRNFLVKYEESNWMHKRMILASKIVDQYAAGPGKVSIAESAKRHLYQAQCNCAYWHGLFGGLYLPHLRSAVFSHIIAAEKIIEDETRGKKEYIDHGISDIDGDGIEELSVSTGKIKLFMKLKGAVLRELDLREARFNLTDTLTRREEYYHRKIAGLGRAAEGDGAISIHEMSTAREEGLEKRLFYDSEPRASLVDHFIDPAATLSSFSRSEYSERGDFATGDYLLQVEGPVDLPVFHFSRKGEVIQGEGRVDLSIDKRITLLDSGRTIDVEYSIKAGGKLKTRFAVENVISFLAGDAPDRFFLFPGRDVEQTNLASTGEEAGLGNFEMRDEYLRLGVIFDFDPVALFWRFPVETVSNSDSGYERVYQGSALVPVWDLSLSEGGSSTIRIRIRTGTL